MKKKQWFVFILSCSISIIFLSLFTFFIIRANSLPDRPVVELLISNPIFPSEWESAEVEAKNIEWKEIRTSISKDSDSHFNSDSESNRVWTDQGGNFPPLIIESIYKYGNPIIAEAYFWLYRPEMVYIYKRPNFSGFCDKNACYPKIWDLSSLSADNVIAVCAMGDPQSCQMWYFWSRYGQYILSVYFFAPNKGLDEISFSIIVQKIEETFLSIMVQSGVMENEN